MAKLFFIITSFLTIFTVRGENLPPYEEGKVSSFKDFDQAEDPMEKGFYFEFNYKDRTDTFSNTFNQKGRLKFSPICGEVFLNPPRCVFATKYVDYLGENGFWEIILNFPKLMPSGEFSMTTNLGQFLPSISFKKKKRGLEFTNILDFSRIYPAKSSCKISVSKRGKSISHKELYGNEKVFGRSEKTIYYHRKLRAMCKNYKKIIGKDSTKNEQTNLSFSFNFHEMVNQI